MVVHNMAMSLHMYISWHPLILVYKIVWVQYHKDQTLSTIDRHPLGLYCQPCREFVCEYAR